jgi:hypothetical protein
MDAVDEREQDKESSLRIIRADDLKSRPDPGLCHAPRKWGSGATLAYDHMIVPCRVAIDPISPETSEKHSNCIVNTNITSIYTAEIIPVNLHVRTQRERAVNPS